MHKRLTILAALVAVFVMAAGAGAGHRTVVDLPSPRSDTTDWSDGTKTTDSIDFTSRVFGYGGDYTYITGQIVQVTVDTATETGFAIDSVDFKLQTRSSHDSALTWWTLWASGLQPVAGFDSVGGYGDGAGGRIYVPPDSMVSISDEFRIAWFYVAEEDSVREHAHLNYGTFGDSITIDPLPEFKADIQFRKR